MTEPAWTRRTPDADHTLCVSCYGRGWCKHCEGSGRVILAPSRRCTWCAGRGECPVCDGDGQLSEADIRDRGIEVPAELQARKTIAPAWLPMADILTFAQGSEFAPDAAWGRERISLSRNGDLAYERRERGTVAKAYGRVSSARVDALIATLASTTFPTMPQASFPPGGTVCKIIVGSANPVSMLIEYYAGLELPGYGDLLRQFGELAAALRDGDAEQLAAWLFVRADGPS